MERESRANDVPALSLQLARQRGCAGIAAARLSASWREIPRFPPSLDHSIALDIKADRFLAFGESASGVSAALSMKDGLLTLSRLNVAALGWCDAIGQRHARRFAPCAERRARHDG
jgi:hypothetical protein